MVANAEFRVPLFGVEEFGLINMPFVPTEIILFADGGLAWDNNLTDINGAPVAGRTRLKFSRSASERVPVFSTGVSGAHEHPGLHGLRGLLRVPLPASRPGPHWGFQIAPGW